MPAPAVECIVCGNNVTKRSTLSLQELGGGSGRACRSHDTVKKLKEVFEKEKEKDRETRMNLQKTQHFLQVMSGTSLVRVMFSFHGVMPEIIYDRLRRNGYSDEIIDEIKSDVERQGGPQLSEEETLATMRVAVDLTLRQLEPQSQKEERVHGVSSM